jgi:hypothetical protein
VGEIVRTDAQLLFETVKSFRAIRDCHRLGHLARVLGLNPPSPEEPTIPEVEELINRLGGKSFGSFEANHIAAQEIQGMLNDLGLRIACPRVGCRKDAMLYCTTGKGSKNGIFVFVHPRPGGQARHGGWASLPQRVSLIPVPTRRARTCSPGKRHQERNNSVEGT